MLSARKAGAARVGRRSIDQTAGASLITPERKMAPERRHAALLLVDFINPLNFTRDRGFLDRAARAARRSARLKHSLKEAGAPVIYANDHFGGWTRDFSALIRDCSSSTVNGSALARVLAPSPDDYPVLKPRNSAFYGTPLDFLLEELHVQELIIAGIAADNCVLFSASDAYLRRYKLAIPRDCVASLRDADRVASLAHMKRVLKADTRSSRHLLSQLAART